MLRCSAEDAKMLEEGMIGDITYCGNELISFVRSADNLQNLKSSDKESVLEPYNI